MPRSSCHAPGFHKTHQVQDRVRWPSRRTGWSHSPIAITPRTIWDALHGGINAYRRYERLRSKGVPHDKAIRKVFGISLPGE